METTKDNASESWSVRTKYLFLLLVVICLSAMLYYFSRWQISMTPLHLFGPASLQYHDDDITPLQPSFINIVDPETLERLLGRINVISPQTAINYLAIFGQLFDLSQDTSLFQYFPGLKNYPYVDATYFFARSRTSDYSDHQQTSIDDLTPQELKAAEKWLIFFRFNYRYIGIIPGDYFTPHGSPTAKLVRVKAALRRIHLYDRVMVTSLLDIPTCTATWMERTGGVFWCPQTDHAENSRLLQQQVMGTAMYDDIKPKNPSSNQAGSAGQRADPQKHGVQPTSPYEYAHDHDGFAKSYSHFKRRYGDMRSAAHVKQHYESMFPRSSHGNDHNPNTSQFTSPSTTRTHTATQNTTQNNQETRGPVEADSPFFSLSFFSASAYGNTTQQSTQYSEAGSLSTDVADGLDPYSLVTPPTLTREALANSFIEPTISTYYPRRAYFSHMNLDAIVQDLHYLVNAGSDSGRGSNSHHGKIRDKFNDHHSSSSSMQSEPENWANAMKSLSERLSAGLEWDEKCVCMTSKQIRFIEDHRSLDVLLYDTILYAAYIAIHQAYDRQVEEATAIGQQKINSHSDSDLGHLTIPNIIKSIGLSVVNNEPIFRDSMPTLDRVPHQQLDGGGYHNHNHMSHPLQQRQSPQSPHSSDAVYEDTQIAFHPFEGPRHSNKVVVDHHHMDGAHGDSDIVQPRSEFDAIRRYRRQHLRTPHLSHLSAGLTIAKNSGSLSDGVLPPPLMDQHNNRLLHIQSTMMSPNTSKLHHTHSIWATPSHNHTLYGSNRHHDPPSHLRKLAFMRHRHHYTQLFSSNGAFLTRNEDNHMPRRSTWHAHETFSTPVVDVMHRNMSWWNYGLRDPPFTDSHTYSIMELNPLRSQQQLSDSTWFLPPRVKQINSLSAPLPFKDSPGPSRLILDSTNSVTLMGANADDGDPSRPKPRHQGQEQNENAMASSLTDGNLLGRVISTLKAGVGMLFPTQEELIEHKTHSTAPNVDDPHHHQLDQWRISYRWVLSSSIAKFTQSYAATTKTHSSTMHFAQPARFHTMSGTPTSSIHCENEHIDRLISALLSHSRQLGIDTDSRGIVEFIELDVYPECTPHSLVCSITSGRTKTGGRQRPTRNKQK